MILLNPIGQWLEIQLEKITGQKLKSNPYLCLLTIVDTNMHSPLMTSILMHMTVTARILYAQHWKSPNVPTEDMFIQNNT